MSVLKEESSFKRFCQGEKDSIIPEHPFGFSWEEGMQLALAEAAVAYAEREVPVGCLLVDKEGEVIAQAHNKNRQLVDVSAHAEILALRLAGRKCGLHGLKGCVLIVTLEPCPMCAWAIVKAGLAGVVYGCCDNLVGAIVSRREYFDPPGVLPYKGIWHYGGVLAKECRQILVNFFVELRHGEVGDAKFW